MRAFPSGWASNHENRGRQSFKLTAIVRIVEA
jgi:hypothetical protein